MMSTLCLPLCWTLRLRANSIARNILFRIGSPVDVVVMPTTLTELLKATNEESSGGELEQTRQDTMYDAKNCITQHLYRIDNAEFAVLPVGLFRKVFIPKTLHLSLLICDWLGGLQELTRS